MKLIFYLFRRRALLAAAAETCVCVWVCAWHSQWHFIFLTDPGGTWTHERFRNLLVSLEFREEEKWNADTHCRAARSPRHWVLGRARNVSKKKWTEIPIGHSVDFLFFHFRVFKDWGKPNKQLRDAIHNSPAVGHSCSHFAFISHNWDKHLVIYSRFFLETAERIFIFPTFGFQCVPHTYTRWHPVAHTHTSVLGSFVRWSEPSDSCARILKTLFN